MIRSILLFPILLFACTNPNTSKKSEQKLHYPTRQKSKEIYSVRFEADTFYANYQGPDFYAGDDVAHQLSNYVADTLGKYLKEQFKTGKFKKIDFEKTVISIQSIGQDSSAYSIKMPMVKVDESQAMTCIDHRGSWVNNVQQIEFDLREFLAALKEQGYFGIEKKRFETESGLYEYWIQFKHPDLQHR